tara:strand:- start:23 stop:442 length:420 start_codon:yes stop_codon:yes gene_type:complete
MYLRNNILKLFILIIFIFQMTINFIKAKDINAHEVYKICNNYYQWVNKNYSLPVDEKMLFNMGKCQGMIQTLGRTMLTLCYENKKNANINKKLTANLQGIKTIDIIEGFLNAAEKDGKLRSYSANSYLIEFISKQWPCK